uniref:uroporphyrinogen-III C-methyltransferase n=1 Tax=Pseudo-nitzschia australis TaxID=44445 RepID=A0A7S4AWV6_9STRA|mmetsp:Transcript_26893/g.59034  ORF Transcript_26893/g.59034 Transcript_26893/m.59034 type:complete len:360 (-) Transcript_26893:262-1341(-)|eukprot:CAMPEP_0168184590 /NCGR_PEP_ID=MMETSP0139_2-20121125/13329_1 /TAXON_ID=44445 /ORGANISM="Pseudo-nitzschia australis, Strain 10249 10 AB" /LENGTH=359 /DNA_ID=CAMNT_0008106239 /DNA_START=46 /DNA_END=1125 /DNA_ORIENTATION=-
MTAVCNNSHHQWLLALVICSLCFEPSVGFLTSNSRSLSSRISIDNIFLFVDNGIDGQGGGTDTGLENYSKKVIESSKENEWGIPDRDTLDPFSATPLEQLENGGRITLVGSGPGDPDLLTVKAYKLLQDPDALVIADRLVSQEILDMVGGEIKVARKLPGCAENAQAEIYWWTHQGLSAGKHVIRLKIGDPYVFGRGGEEVLQFRKFGVESKVVPGVSAAFSAPLLANIPVTHRGYSNQVVMCTGYGREGSSPDLIQYHEEQTIVFLMAVGRLRVLCERLIKLAGYPKDTPVGIIERAGCPNQRTVIGNMQTIADIAEKHNIQAPSTIVVGKVVNVLLEKDESGMVTQGLLQNATAISV